MENMANHPIPTCPTPPIGPPPPAGSQTFVGPGEVNISQLTDAINSIHGMLISFQAQISANMNQKFSSLEDQVLELHDKFAKQDSMFREMTQGMATKSDVSKLESTLASMASQADAKFQDLDQELDQIRAIAQNYKLENLRLHNRLATIEEKSFWY